MKIILIILSLAIIAVAPFFGQIDISLQNLLNSSTTDYKIFFDLRVPRVLLAFFVGAILALSGLVFQTIFRNPMSTPFTLGVASGATLFTAIAIIIGFSAFISLFAFFGAVVTIIVLFMISARFKTYETSSLLLVGIALSFFYSASLMIVFFLSDLQENYEIVRFTMGSLDVVGFNEVYLVTIAGVFLATLVKKQSHHIKLLLTSHEFAFLKGLNVKKTNYILLLSVSVAVGISVSVTGPIGFVGLIIPHILKNIMRQSADRLIVPIFFYGGVFLVLCDVIARNLSTASDIPIGVITAFIGTPFFIYLIISLKRQN